MLHYAIIPTHFFRQNKEKHLPKSVGVLGVLLFDNFQNFHGASLDTNAAGDALGNGILVLLNHDLHGAGFHALAAANTVLLIDHVYTGLRVLGDRVMLTAAHALTALNTGHGLCAAVFSYDFDAAQILMKLLIKGGGTSTHTFQASHALHIFLNSKLLHN